MTTGKNAQLAMHALFRALLKKCPNGQKCTTSNAAVRAAPSYLKIGGERFRLRSPLLPSFTPTHATREVNHAG